MICAGAVARFATLDLQSFHHDEAVMAGRVLQSGLGATLEQMVDSERSPPLYYLLSWGWSQLFGTGEVGLRSLSALLGTLMIPASYLAGRELVSKRAGMIAAALVAFNPLLVWYSQEARSYILMALLVALSLAILGRALKRASPRVLALWACASALAVCSHYFAIFLVAPQIVWLVCASHPRRPVVSACAAVLLACAVLVALAIEQQGEGRRDGFTADPLPGRLAEVALDYSASEDPDPLSASSRVDAVQIVAGIGGGLLVLGAGGLVLFRGRGEERRGWLLMTWIAAASIGMPLVAAAAGFDFFKPRNLMAGVVPVLLGSAIGFSVRRARGLGLAGAGALCALYASVVLAVGLSAEMQRENWRGVARVIGRPDSQRLIAIPQNGDNPLILYLGASRFVGKLGRAGIATDEVVAVSTTNEIYPPSGFVVADRTRVPPLFTVWRLRASKPRVLRSAEVLAVLRERDTVLYDGGP